MKSYGRLFTGLVAALVVTTLLVPAQVANAATVTAASAVRSVSATDAWSSSAPHTARVRLTWARPVSTFGATVIGYKIEKSTNGTTWASAVSNTRSTKTSVVISSGLKAGVLNYFRVRAITAKGSTAKTGNASVKVAKSLTASPSSPVLLGLTKITAPADGTRIVRWLPQSAGQRGGLAVTYKVVATQPGANSVACSTSTKTYCKLSGLAVGSVYSLKLSSRNSRGSGVNVDEISLADADFYKQWYLGTENGVAATRAWTATRGLSSIVVAVLDTGFTIHPDLEGQWVRGYDFISNIANSGDGDGRDADPTDTGDWNSSQPENSWHGTHVSGIIAAKQNSIGISGIAPKVRIQPVRVLGPGNGSSNDLALAIRWAAGQDLNGQIFNGETLSDIPINATPAKVINMSMASTPTVGTNEYQTCPRAVQSAIDYAESKGVVLVAAAGNGDSAYTPVDQGRVFPTNCDGPISVGSTGPDGDVAFYSNFGQTLNLTAPGGDQQSGGIAGGIWSTSNDGIQSYGVPNYKYEQGTSMAAPVVSAIIALMFSLRPAATHDEIIKAVLNSLVPFSAGSQCATVQDRCGAGAINAATALEALVAITG